MHSHECHWTLPNELCRTSLWPQIKRAMAIRIYHPNLEPALWRSRLEFNPPLIGSIKCLSSSTRANLHLVHGRASITSDSGASHPRSHVLRLGTNLPVRLPHGLHTFYPHYGLISLRLAATMGCRQPNVGDIRLISSLHNRPIQKRYSFVRAVLV
jgi:hypothetical protein